MPLASRQLTDIVTLTRATSGWYFDSTGTLQTAANNVARFDYDPSTLAADGLLIEEQRTNSVPNNTGVGAAAGTPGTAPTGWTVSGAANGVNRSIVGAGTENGIDYVDIRFWTSPGVPSTAASNATILPVASGSQVATQGQTWASSVYVKLVGGSTSGWTSLQVFIGGRDGANALIENSSVFITPTAAALRTQRTVVARTMGNAATVSVTGPQINLNYPNGATLDITLRIGLPQLELTAIQTTVSTATVAAGGTGYAVGNVLTVQGGTFGTAATLTVSAVSSGVITAVTVTTGGAYTAMPTSPASVTGGAGSGATFTLTPTSMSGFATSPIKTTGSTVTRNADAAVVNTGAWYNQTEGTVVCEVINGVQGAANASNQTVGLWSTTQSALGSFNGYGANLNVFQNTTNVSINGRARYAPTGKNNTIYFGPNVYLSANATYKVAFAWSASDVAGSANGAAVVSTANTAAVDMGAHNQLWIGNQNSGGSPPYQLNGWVRRLTYYPRRLSNAELQTVST